MCETSPVLRHHWRDSSIDLRAEKSTLGLSSQLSQHAWHGERHRHPLVELPESVDPHANEKHNKLAVEPRRHALLDDLGHEWRLPAGRRPPNGSRLSCGASASGRKRPALRYLRAGAQTSASSES